MVGAFSHKFSIAPSTETTDRMKKVRVGAKMVWTFSITVPSMVVIVGHMPAVDEKVMFFSSFFCFVVTLWNYEVCDDGNTMKQCNFQNNNGTSA